MADLDVVDVLYDPDFASFFNVARSVKSTLKGRTTLAPTVTTDLVGVVTPATTRELMRLDDLQRRRGSIVVVTGDFDLSAGGKLADGTLIDADKVEFPQGSGQIYVVAQVDDLENFGPGFVRATCLLEILGS